MGNGVGSLSTVVSSGVSGRELAQQNAAVIAQNMSNVNTEGYSRKELLHTARVLGGIGNGVEVVKVKRVTDEIKIEQLRDMASTVNKLEILNQFNTDLTERLGTPGNNNSLSASINDLRANIEKLSMRPEIDSSRTTVIHSAERLAQDIQRLANFTQNLRQTSDQAIANCVTDINIHLNTLGSLNKEIRQSGSKGMSIVELEDKRDEELQKLSSFLDFRAQKAADGTVGVFTKNGHSLLQMTVHQLSFSPTAGIDATVTYPGIMNGILIDGDPAKDITPNISMGKVGGLINVRDQDLPAFQNALDELTAKLRDEVNKEHNRGTASHVPHTLNGTRNSFLGIDPIVGQGNVKVAVIDRASGNILEETIINLATIGNHNNIMTQIDGMVNANASFTATGELQLQAANAAHGIAIASTSNPEAYITSGGTNYGFSHYFGLNDFFVTGSTFTGKTPGISSLLQVRSEITTDVKRITNTRLDINAALNNRAISSGGNESLIALAKMFDVTVSFNASGKIPALSNTINGYASNLIQYTADNARHTQDKLDKESYIQNLATKNLDTIRGVNLQEEVINLMKWQRQQKACTELILTAQSMLDEALRLRR